jgi:hypothetical protein
MDPVAQLQRLGWEWRPDGAGTGAGPGVQFSVVVGGRTQRVFVPLQRVWVIFDKELQAVGCVGAASVGAPFSVGGFFSFIKKAASSVANAAKSAVKRVVPKAIQRAAAKVVKTAKSAVNTVARSITKIPVLGTVVKAAHSLALLPASAASQLLQGRRIDHIAVDQFKSAVSNVRTLAPYVQTVISFVPGVGTGLSAGLGGALALAEGQTITQAMEAALKSSIPGGPLAQAAFSVASGVMQGKPIDQIAINALPISDQQKALLVRGLGAAKDLAAGKRVDAVLLDQAVRSLPPALQKAVQIGTAIGHAKNLQGALGAAAHGAAQLAGNYAAGTDAARAFARGVRTPAVMNALHRAEASRTALSHIVRQAQQGHPQATHIVNALQRNPFGRAFPSFPSHMPLRPPLLPSRTQLPSYARAF